MLGFILLILVIITISIGAARYWYQRDEAESKVIPFPNRGHEYDD